jgi:hypothetical protein
MYVIKDCDGLYYVGVSRRQLFWRHVDFIFCSNINDAETYESEEQAEKYVKLLEEKICNTKFTIEEK